MSFDLKYDRDGRAIKQPELANIESVAEVVLEPELSVEEVEESSNQEIVPIEEIIEEEQVEQIKPVAKAKPTPSESFKQLKDAKEQQERGRQLAERERDDYARRLRELEAKNQPQQKQPEPEEDYNININPDDLVEGKHLSKFDRKIQKLEQQLKQYEQKASATAIDSRIRSQYPDFDSVVSKDNIEILRQNYPEIYQTLNASTDLYSTAVSAYTMIKRFGIIPDESYKADVERAQKNAMKPRPLASVSPQQGESPLTKANAFANGLTPDLQKQLYKEMLEAKKNM